MNLARDALRHGRMATGKEAALITHFERAPVLPAAADTEIGDDALRLMFVCCHPSIASDAQVILALRCFAASARLRSPGPS